jgi:hypothetical protein
MMFFFNLIVSVLYFFLLERWIGTRKFSNFVYVLMSSPILCFWLIICGGQYDVGADYFSYLQIFNGERTELYLLKGEYLFYALVVFCNRIGLTG